MGMSIAQSMLPEFDQEMANTRKVLARLPDDKFAWKPHDKSMSLGQLANHIAHMATWGALTLEQSTFDVAPVGAPPVVTPKATSAPEVLEHFDAGAKKFRALLAEASDAALQEDWSLLMGGTAIMTMPRSAVLRSMVLNHIIHHRAQLTVYYRLNDIPVPGLYGPSADEK